MIDFEDCYQALFSYEEFSSWVKILPEKIESNYAFLKHGDLAKWQEAVNTLANLSIKNPVYHLGDTVQIGNENDLNVDEKLLVEKALLDLCP